MYRMDQVSVHYMIPNTETRIAIISRQVENTTPLPDPHVSSSVAALRRRSRSSALYTSSNDHEPIGPQGPPIPPTYSDPTRSIRPTSPQLVNTSGPDDVIRDPTCNLKVYAFCMYNANSAQQ